MSDDGRLPRIEYTPENIYCVATSLADVAARMIRDLAKYSGHLSGMSEEEWKGVLRRISEGFEAVEPLMDGRPTVEEREALTAKFDDAMDLLKEHYFALWF